jgi:lysophospholipase L1-like esterase
VAALAVGGVLLAAIGLEQHRSTGSAARSPKGPYVALGDSYTSGPNIPAQTGTPGGCARSDHDYPSLVAQELELKAADFRDVSCSGATIADLSTPQTTSDGVNPTQLSALSATTELVTLGIGGNDMGFSELITRCVAADIFYTVTGGGKHTGDDAPCRGNTSPATPTR